MSEYESPTENSQILPVLPLRDIVVFPHMIVPLFVGREKSVRALEEVMAKDKQIMLVAQREASVDDPQPADTYEIGTVATVMQLLKLPDGTVKVLVEGGHRARIEEYTYEGDYYEARTVAIEDEPCDDSEVEALARSVIGQFESYVEAEQEDPCRSAGHCEFHRGH